MAGINSKKASVQLPSKDGEVRTVDTDVSRSVGGSTATVAVDAYNRAEVRVERDGKVIRMAGTMKDFTAIEEQYGVAVAAEMAEAFIRVLASVYEIAL